MACGSGCSTACSRLGVTDWLENMLGPDTPEHRNIYEIRFKTTRKAFYRNVNNLELITGDLVAVEAERGYDVGMITMGGELARLQMKKRKVNEKDVLKIYRVATEQDIQKLEKARGAELGMLHRTRTLVTSLRLNMKVSDIEMQGDGSKATFYYTADQRVDFRELIKQLATEFRIRVEMKQIGMRQESAIVGGVGSCGRELCCASWLTDFKTVNTTAARYQNISLNPMKITGMCGRLKCCLNYELETYLDALKDIPQVREIHTELGVAVLQKTDIFQRKMWFGMGGESAWVALSADKVRELAEQNKRGIRPASLTALEEEMAALQPKTKEPDFVDVVGQSQLHERMAADKRRKKKKGKGIVRPGGGQRPQQRPRQD